MPRFKLQRPCNYLLYSDSCGAIKSNEKFFTEATLTIDGIGKYIVLSDALDSADKTRRFFKLDANVSVVAVGRSAIVTAWCDKTIKTFPFLDKKSSHTDICNKRNVRFLCSEKSKAELRN